MPITYTGEQAKTANPQWDSLLAKWKKDGVYVISFAFPGDIYLVCGADKLVTKESIISNNLRVVNNLVLYAESIEEATELAKDCPVLSYGGSFEVREILKPLML